MNDAPTPLELAFDAVVAGRGSLTSFQADAARLLAQLSLASKTITDAGQLISLSSEVTKLEALLPAIGTDDGELMDLSRLTDSELLQLQRLQDKACNVASPRWAVEDEPDPPAERPMGECEKCACDLGRYLDKHCASWKGRALTEDERITIMNHFTAISDPAHTILREVFRPIYDGEKTLAVRDAIIAEQDRLARTPSAAATLAKSLSDNAPRPAHDAQPDNVIALGAYPPFNFGGQT